VVFVLDRDLRGKLDRLGGYTASGAHTRLAKADRLDLSRGGRNSASSISFLPAFLSIEHFTEFEYIDPFGDRVRYGHS